MGNGNGKHRCTRNDSSLLFRDGHRSHIWHFAHFTFHSQHQLLQAKETTNNCCSSAVACRLSLTTLRCCQCCLRIGYLWPSPSLCCTSAACGKSEVFRAGFVFHPVTSHPRPFPKWMGITMQKVEGNLRPHWLQLVEWNSRPCQIARNRMRGMHRNAC